MGDIIKDEKCKSSTPQKLWLRCTNDLALSQTALIMAQLCIYSVFRFSNIFGSKNLPVSQMNRQKRFRKFTNSRKFRTLQTNIFAKQKLDVLDFWKYTCFSELLKRVTTLPGLHNAWAPRHHRRFWLQILDDGWRQLLQHVVVCWLCDEAEAFPPMQGP